MSYQHYVDILLKDDDINKTDLDVMWRARSCSKGYFDSRERMAEWTGRNKKTIDRSIRKLIKLGYMIVTHRGFEPIQDRLNVEEKLNVEPDKLKVEPKKLNVEDRTIYNLLEPNKNKTGYASSIDPEKRYVFISKDDVQKLLALFEHQKEFGYWINTLSEYAINKPSQFKTNKNHYLTILSWRRRAIADGKIFYASGPAGPGYYNPQKIKSWIAEQINS